MGNWEQILKELAENDFRHGGFIKSALDELESLRARVQELEDGMGEPVAWYVESDDGECHLYFDKQDMLREVLNIYTYYPLYRTPQPTQTVLRKAADKCEKSIREYRCNFTVDEDGDGYPIIDALTPPYDKSITRGMEEVDYLVDAVAGGILAIQHDDSALTHCIEAAVAAALRKAAEVCAGHGNMLDQHRSWVEKNILSIPHDDSALREICMRVLRAKRELENYHEDSAIVDRVLGEKK